VVLVGGMTRMPRVQQAHAKFFEREPCKGVHPDEVVALGAAIQGAALVDEAPEMVLLDVTPHTLGIMVVGGYFEELIPQNTTVPTSRSKIFTTVRDNQTAVKIRVLQGEAARRRNELLGEFILTGLRRAPKGHVEIEVTFEINTDGIVSVHAKDLETGQAQSILTASAASRKTNEEHDVSARYLVGAAPTSISGRPQEAKPDGRNRALFPEIERVVGGADFGRDAIAKRARGRPERDRAQGDRGREGTCGAARSHRAHVQGVAARSATIDDLENGKRQSGPPASLRIRNCSTPLG
jgi:molecular chaperone DnaK